MILQLFLVLQSMTKLFKEIISLRLPQDIREELREEAEEKRLSISDIIRDRISKSKSSFSLDQCFEEILNRLDSLELKVAQFQNPQVQSSGTQDPMAVETLSLLREFLLERNAQVVKKVDEKMEKRFGKDRKKV